MQMSQRTLLMLVAGFIVSLTVISVRKHVSESVVDRTEMQAARVMIVKRDMAAGMFVDAARDLDWAPAPKATDNAARAYLYEGDATLAGYNGAVVRRPLRAGEPVLADMLTRSGDGGFMSAVLEPGMRAVSIAVNATSGNAGFISPGDRVDLIVTHRVHVNSSDTITRQQEESVVSDTFVHDVRVIAVDQQLDNPDNKAILAKTVTVEVAPAQAEKIAAAEEKGKISMALRSLAGSAPKAVPQPQPGEVTVADVYGAEVAEAQAVTEHYVNPLLAGNGSAVPRVVVIRGDQVQNIDFYQEGR